MSRQYAPAFFSVDVDRKADLESIEENLKYDVPKILHFIKQWQILIAEPAEYGLSSPFLKCGTSAITNVVGSQETGYLD